MCVEKKERGVISNARAASHEEIERNRGDSDFTNSHERRNSPTTTNSMRANPSFAVALLLIHPVAAFFSATSQQHTSCASQNDYRLAASANDDGDEPNTKDSASGTWNPLSLAVLKLGFTEPAWSSLYNYNKSSGIFSCANCRSPLFSSAAKYDSGSGWPSFWRTVDSERVSLKKEWDGRIECLCANCGGHLGHVFPDGPQRLELDDSELETVPESDPAIGYNVQHSGGEADKKSKYSRMPRYCVNGAALRFDEDGEL